MKFDIFKPLVIHEQGRQTAQGNAIFPASGEGTIHDRLFVICEGQGDERKGKKAGDIVAATLSDYIFQNTCPDEPMEETLLQNALAETYDSLNKECAQGEAATMAMLYFHRHGCMAAHIGSNRIYHIRPKKHALMYRSRDNANALASQSKSMAEPIKAFITDVSFGDYFLIMSKGATSKLNDSKVMEIVCANGSDEDKLAKFKDVLKDCEQNHSLYFIHVSGVMNEAFDENLADNEQRLMAAYLSGVNESKPQQKKETPVVEKKNNSPKPQNNSPKPEEDDTAQLIKEQNKPVKEEKEKKKKEFPVVWVTAILLVIAAVALLYWGQGKVKHSSQQKTEVKPKENVKKEKDTINVMKGAKDKPLELTPEEKAKMEEEKKKAEEEKKKAEEERKKAEEERKKQEENNTPSTQEPSGDNNPSATQEPAKEPPVTAPQTPAKPAGEPQNTNPTPPANSNEPRPVIPPN